MEGLQNNMCRMPCGVELQKTPMSLMSGIWYIDWIGKAGYVRNHVDPAEVFGTENRLKLLI